METIIQPLSMDELISKINGLFHSMETIIQPSSMDELISKINERNNNGYLLTLLFINSMKKLKNIMLSKDIDEYNACIDALNKIMNEEMFKVYIHALHTERRKERLAIVKRLIDLSQNKK
jgi:uncharacterized protein YqgV (UPF0045/DUF77 family)